MIWTILQFDRRRRRVAPVGCRRARPRWPVNGRAAAEGARDEVEGSAWSAEARDAASCATGSWSWDPLTFPSRKASPERAHELVGAEVLVGERIDEQVEGRAVVSFRR